MEKLYRLILFSVLGLLGSLLVIYFSSYWIKQTSSNANDCSLDRVLSFSDVERMKGFFVANTPTFDQILTMSMADGTETFIIRNADDYASGMPPQRVQSYRHLLQVFGPNVILLRNEEQILEISIEGHLPTMGIGSGCLRGFAYIPEKAEPRTHIIENVTQIVSGGEDTYFIRLAQHWYIFQAQYQ